MPTENDQIKARGGIVLGASETLPAELEGGRLKAAQAPATVAAEVTRAEAAEAVLEEEIDTEQARAEVAEGLLAPLASPTLTGAPTAPLQAENDNSTKLATTAYADRAADEAREDAEAAGPGEHSVTLAKLALAVSKQIPAEHGRSAAMVSGAITIAAPATTASGAILLTAEGGIATVGALTVAERTPGTGFKVESTLVTGTARVNWSVWTE